MTGLKKPGGVIPMGAFVLGAVIALPLLSALGGAPPSATGTATSEGYVLPQILGLEDANTYVPADNP
jgi:hypothetical protein